MILAGGLLPGVLENLIAATLGGAATATGAYTYARAKHFLFERKVKVAGDYISCFEDTQEGERVRLYAHAKIRQRGRKITGRSTAYNNQAGKEREWELKGEIFETGTILGNYVCVTPHQTGMGTFSLEIASGRLVGHWSGYDSQNHIMNHGEYVFTRVAEKIIRDFEDSDRAAVVSISAATLGQGYFTNPTAYASAERSCVLVAVDPNSHKMIGFAAGKLLGAKEFESTYGASIQKRSIPIDIQDADDHGRIGFLQTIGVDPDSQGRGTGFALLAALSDRLRAMGASVLVAPAWRAHGRTNVGGVLSALSMTPFGELPRHWQKECNAGDFRCPERPLDGRCVCDVVLFKS